MSAAIAPDQLPPYFPEDTPRKQVEDALHRLRGAKQAWTRTTTQERVDLLRVCLNGICLEGRDWVRESCRAKGHALGSPGEGEEWLSGPVVLARGIRLLMEAIAAERQPPLPAVRTGTGGQSIVDVFPATHLRPPPPAICAARSGWSPAPSPPRAAVETPPGASVPSSAPETRPPSPPLMLSTSCLWRIRSSC